MADISFVLLELNNAVRVLVGTAAPDRARSLSSQSQEQLDCCTQEAHESLRA